MYEELIEKLRFNARQVRQYNLMVLLFNAAHAIEELSKKRESACWGCKCEKIEPFRWIPVTERLPESVCKSYLCLTDAGYHCEVRWTNNIFGLGESDRRGWSIADVPQYCKVTHWMLLPEPPKEEA